MRKYIEERINNIILREFSVEDSEKELDWHRDSHNRYVEVLEGDDWLFQFDNELPFKVIPGDHFYIQANTYHRLLRGTTTLKIKITEDINKTNQAVKHF